MFNVTYGGKKPQTFAQQNSNRGHKHVQIPFDLSKFLPLFSIVHPSMHEGRSNCENNCDLNNDSTNWLFFLAFTSHTLTKKVTVTLGQFNPPSPNPAHRQKV
jgi:hypothetical protein